MGFFSKTKPVADSRSYPNKISPAFSGALRKVRVGSVADVCDASRDYSTWQHVVQARPSVIGQKRLVCVLYAGI